MEKIVAICQPNFLPWLGYFEMAHRADIYVMLDDVQYIKREWINRNRILCRSDKGWQWISVPLKKKKRESLINEMEIENEQQWNTKFLKTIYHVYGKAPFYKIYADVLEDLMLRKWDGLCDLNITLIKHIYQMLGIEDNLIVSSQLNINSKKDDKLAQICEHFGATVYLANNGSKSYIDASKFYRRNIGFVFQDYQHPEYVSGSYRFVPYLSVLDLLFWHGHDALNIILKGRKENWRDDIRYHEQPTTNKKIITGREK